MYKIIGGDGREYGPVTEAELRKWIAEGRLNGQSLAKAEGEAEFRQLATFPEFTSAFGMTAPHSEAAAAVAVDWDKQDYELDIGGCLSRGWALFWDNLGILLGCTVLFILIVYFSPGIVSSIINMIFSQIVPDTVLYSAPFMLMVAVLLQALTVIFTGPVVGGYYYVFIKTMRGEAASVGDLFAGFQKSFSQLYLGFLINNLLMVLCSVPFYIVWAARSAPVLIHMKHIQNPNELHGQLMDLWSAAASSYPVLLLCLIPIAYLATSLRFVIPLIIDQGMDVWTAIGTSFKMVHRHWFTVFGLVICTGIIWLLGFCLCCIPAIFTVGIATAATMFAYESIFCERRN